MARLATRIVLNEDKEAKLSGKEFKLMQNNSPLVSVITPVYNGERFLHDCIESILAQSHQNWEYIIVDNCSTDGTAGIIERYIRQDPRIRVHTNDHTVNVIENHNIAFRLISPESQYCKLVHADDWLYPECLERMIEVAESSPSAGVVGSYCLAGKRVKCDGLAYPALVTSGAEICRQTLLGNIYLFWSPSCLMIKSSVVRDRQPFFTTSHLHADVYTLYEILQDHDFGFVHQVLTYIRAHEKSMTSQDTQGINTQLLSRLFFILKFGAIYLDEREYQSRRADLIKRYYQSLSIAAFEGRKAGFWKYQKREMGKLGHPLNQFVLMREILSTIVFNPRMVARLLKKRFSSKPGS